MNLPRRGYAYSDVWTWRQYRAGLTRVRIELSKCEADRNPRSAAPASLRNALTAHGLGRLVRFKLSDEPSLLCDVLLTFRDVGLPPPAFVVVRRRVHAQALPKHFGVSVIFSRTEGDPDPSELRTGCYDASIKRWGSLMPYLPCAAQSAVTSSRSLRGLHQSTGRDRLMAQMFISASD